MKNLILLMLAISPIFCFSQLEIQPVNPSENQTILIKYPVEGTNHTKIELRIRIQEAMQDGSFTYRWFRLKRDATSNYNTSFVASPGASAIKIELYSNDAEIEKRTVLLYEKLKLNTVPGAQTAFKYSEDMKEAFSSEIALHPSNFLAYGQFFNVLSYLNSDNAPKIIGAHIHTLEEWNDNTNPALLAALCVGYAKTWQLPEAKKKLLVLLQKFPTTNYPNFAFNYFEYERFKAGHQSGDSEVLKACKFVFTRYPHAPISGNTNLLYQLMEDSTIPFQQFKKTIGYALLRQPKNLQLEEILNRICLLKSQQLQEAKKALLKIVERMQAGDVHQYYRMQTQMLKTMLGRTYQMLGEVEIQLNLPTEAAQTLSTAMHYFDGTNDFGNVEESLLKYRAAAYLSAGNKILATEDYLHLYHLGDTTAICSLKSLFNDTHKNGDFHSYLREEGNRIQKSPKEVAPPFSAFSQEGNNLSLESFRGKMVVLNFWGLGCGPCIKEIPELNKLVEHYKNRKDVVFLALAGDEAEAVQRFLKKQEFYYMLARPQSAMWKDYQIDAMPIHMVIDKEGKIVKRIKGAIPGINELLAKVIDKYLQD